MKCVEITEEAKFQDYFDIVEELNSFQCPSWILKKSSLPECPSLGFGEKTTVPETFPKAFVILSSALNESALLEMVEQNIRDNPQRLPVFSYQNFGDPSFKDKLVKKHPKINWNEHLINSASNEAFVRDQFASRINDQGSVEVFNTFGSGAANEFGETLKKCNIVYEPKKISNSYTGKGGNFLTLLPGINITTAIDVPQSQSGYNSDNTIIFPTLTIVKHIDEILQPIQTEFDKKGCPKITALIASPEKTKKILQMEAEKNSSTLFFTQVDTDNNKKLSSHTKQLLNSIPKRESFESGYNKLPNVKQICTEYYDLPESQDLDARFAKNKKIQLRNSKFKTFNAKNPTKTLSLEFTKGMSDADFKTQIEQLKNPDYDLQGREILISGDLNDDQQKEISKAVDDKWRDLKIRNGKAPFEFTTKAYASSKGMNKHCNDLTVKDVYQVLNSETFSKENDELQTHVSNLKFNIEKKIAKEFPNCPANIDWIDTPVIKKDGAWALPNSVNSLPTTSSSFALPEPYSDVFKTYLSKEFSKRKLSPIWVDTFGLNNPQSPDDEPLEGGNVHCLTNSIPVCRPKK